METIKDKKILVVGATGDIGTATVKMLASTGAKLFITSTDAVKLRTLADSFNIPSEQTFVLDYKDSSTILQTANKILDAVSSIDIIINAAGIGIIKPFEQISQSEFEHSLTINLTGPFLLFQAFLPSMKEQKKGLIINIPGVLGKTPMAGATAYAASKYGLNGMMKSLREEVKRTDIRITQLFLGGVDSSFWNTIDLRVQRDKMIMAEEVGKAIWFLCQQPSSGVVSEMVLQPFNHQAI